MRKHQQKTILDFISTLKEAHNELSTNAKMDTIVSLLSDCQEFAIAIGNYVDDIKGEGTHTVSLLEEYCEQLYKFSLEIVGKKLESIKPEMLEEYVDKIEHSVLTELKPNRIEVVFLSYKASMSDSLESIYYAAKADPNCDVFWIPIPYFEYDNKASGTVKKMCFEGAEFYNADIECFDWQLYDIENRHPDVIITNNPYDATNQVISVHPAFYCSRLRDQTDLLVYIPYFVTSDEIDDYFCLLPGCKYAHMIIVQSEKIREKYIETYENAYDDNFGNPKEKFIALGSPKFDKLFQSNMQYFDIPEEWIALLNWKKAILYNTSLHGLLHGGEQYLRKLHHVFESFHQRNDIVLWWRPHPFSEATYAAMQPGLLKEYQCIIDDYKKKGWGIFDDSPDLHRAISATAAYYGDESSLVSMFLMIHKPVLIQNYEKYVSDGENQVLIFENMVSTKNDFWITPINFNSLFRICKDTMQVEHISIFPKEKICQWRQYFSMVHVENKIYFSPFSADNIAVYSIDNGTFEHIEIPPQSIKAAVELNQDAKFSQIFHYQDCLILIPNTYPGILLYDLKSKKTEVITDWIIHFEQCATENMLGYFFRGIIVEDALYLACSGANAIFRMNLDTFAYEIHQIKNNNVGYSGICFDGENFWLIPVSLGSIVKWNYTYGVLFEYDEYVHEVLCEKYFPFQNISFVGKYVWVLAAFGNHALKIDVDTSEVAIADEFQTELKNPRSLSDIIPNNNYILQEADDGYLYAYSARSNRLLLYEYNNNRMEYITITMSNDDLVKYNAEQLRRIKLNLNEGDDRKNECILYEPIHPLNNFINMVNDTFGDKPATTQTTATTQGYKVYNKIIENILP